MSYIEVATLTPRTLPQIAALHPDTSFPGGTPDLTHLGYATYVQTAKPAFNPLTQRVVSAPPILVGDHYEQQWAIEALSAPEAAAELDKARKRRWREVKKLRDDKIRNGGIPLNGEWYPSDATAKSDILWVLSIGSNTGQRIELLDGSMANLTVNRATDLRAAGATQSAAISAYADTLKTQIDASNDPDSIDITAGWPATYVPA